MTKNCQEPIPADWPRMSRTAQAQPGTAPPELLTRDRSLTHDCEGGVKYLTNKSVGLTVMVDQQPGRRELTNEAR